MKLSLILEAVDRASRPLDRVRDATGGLGRSAGRASNDVRGLDRRMDGAARSARRMERAAQGIGTGLAAASRRGIGALAALDRRLSVSRAHMEKLAFSAGSLIGSTIRSGVVAGGAIAGAGITAALYKVVSAGLANEKYRTQLNGLEGSAEAGQRAFGWVTSFAKKTPYEMTEVMEAFIALKAYGIDPTNGTLEMLGNTAAGMGKGLMQAVEMLADAQTGEFERMKEFGVKASVQGDKVTLRWQKNGKEMSKTVKQTATDIRQALMGIMNDRFAGGMNRLALTTAGKWSNLMDMMTQTAARVWETSFGPVVNKHLDRLLSKIDQMEKDGSLKKWAEEASDGLGSLVETIASADWQGFSDDIRSVAGALGQIYDMAGKAAGALSEVRKFMADKETQADQVIGGLSWDSRTGGLRYSPPSWMKSGQATPAPNVAPFKDVRSRQRAGALGWKNPNEIPFIDASKPQSSRDERWKNAMRPARQRPSAPLLDARSKPAAPPTGKITIDIKTDRGTTAKPTKLSAKGVDLDVNVGRAMSGFA